jgi:ribosomal protein S14
MKKLLEKDKILRLKNLTFENHKIVLKSIFKNLNFFTLIRWNASIKFQNLSSKSNKHAIINRCVYSINKKRFNKLTNFSRHIFLKLIRTGQINGMKKSSW